MESWAKLVSDEFDRRIESPDHALDDCQIVRSLIKDFDWKSGSFSSSISAHNFGHDSRNGNRYPSVRKVFKKVKDTIDSVADILIF